MPEFVTPDVWVKGGLLSPDHRKAMGEALWLYLYLQSIVRFDGPDAGRTLPERPYRHKDAAAVLGLDERTVRRHFDQLKDAGYLDATRTQYGAHVAITKYLPQSTRRRRPDRRVRSEPTADRTNLTGRPDKSDNEIGQMCPPDRTDVSAFYKEDKRTNDSNVQAPPVTPLAPRPAPKPNKSAELIDALRAADVPVEMAPRDHGALKRSSLSVSQVAEAYCAAYRGEWGDTWLQDNLSVHVVIDRWAGYMAAKTQPSPKRRTNGRPVSALDGIADEMCHLMAQGNGHDEYRNGHLAEDAGAPGPAHLLARPGQAHRQLPQPPGRGS